MSALSKYHTLNVPVWEYPSYPTGGAYPLESRTCTERQFPTWEQIADIEGRVSTGTCKGNHFRSDQTCCGKQNFRDLCVLITACPNFRDSFLDITAVSLLTKFSYIATSFGGK